MLLLRYSNKFSGFSDVFIPLPLFEIKLELPFMIDATINYKIEQQKIIRLQMKFRKLNNKIVN